MEDYFQRFLAYLRVVMLDTFFCILNFLGEEGWLLGVLLFLTDSLVL